MTTASVITGITDEELEALVRGGWVDDGTSTPGWVRWVMVEDWLPVVKQWVFPLLTLSEWKATFGSDENTWADSLNPAQSPAVGRNKIPADPNPPPEPNKTAAQHPPLARTKPGNLAPRHNNQPRPSPTDDTRLLLRNRPGLNPPQPSRARPRNSRPQNAQPQTAPTTRNTNSAPTNQKTTTPPGKPTDGTQGRVPPIPARKNQKTTAPPDKPDNLAQATHSVPTKTHSNQTAHSRPPDNRPQTAPTTRNANPAQTTHSAPTETRRTQTAHPAPPTTTDPNPPPEPNKTAAPHPPFTRTKPGNPAPRHINQPRPSPTDDTRLLLHHRPGLNPPRPSRTPRPPDNRPQTAPTARNANPAQATHSAPTEARRTQAASPSPPTTTRKTRLAAPHPPLAWAKQGKPIPPGIPASPVRPAPTTCGPLVATAPVGDRSSCAGRGGR